MATTIYRVSQRFPRFMRKLLRSGVVRQLPAGYDVDTHFNPHYGPWDQRMCLVPNGDLFRAIGKGRASVVTDRVETFTERGLRLASGEELEADVVVTATGLNLLALGGLRFEVDGRDVPLPETMAYKSMMLSGVPNFAYALGYTNASWTLKADLTAEYVCRLLNHMEARGHGIAVPERDPSVAEAPFLDFKAGYVLRSLDQFPKQGDRAPWRVHQSYPRDLVALRFGSVVEGMRFSGGAPAAPTAPRPPVPVAAAQ
jgi:cation diffusion facilitator CzcD-associated flavoprotein CzcO